MTRSRGASIGRGVSLAWRRAILLVLVFIGITRAGSDGATKTRPTLEVPERLRLLVVAPHPDDETLGAAGLMQRVRRLGGHVSVAYLTSGDGYVEAVELETGRRNPKPRDFVGYGEQRLREATRALQAISIKRERSFIFGFPDGGLLDLLTTHWGSRRPYVSPYTADDRPPYPESLSPTTAYSGIALERELTLLLNRIRPQWIVVTAPWDVHSDHCAAFYFVSRALRRVHASDRRAPSPRLLAYTVHRPDWPGFSEGTSLDAPTNVSAGTAQWRFLELTSEELDGKGRALDEYASQMDIMAVLLRSFVRPNEVFAVYGALPTEPAEICGRPRRAIAEAAELR